MFIGVGLLLKPPFALLILPLIAMYVVAGDRPSAARLVAPVAAALAAYLALNHYMFGAPWTVAQEWWRGSLIRGAVGSLVHIKYGFLIVAPAAIAAFMAWPAFFRAHPRDATVLAAGILLLFGLYASYGGWTGATCYAARHFVPLLPLIFVPLVKLPDMALWRRSWLRRGVVAICAVSIALNGIAAMAYWKYWDTNPVLIAIRWMLPNLWVGQLLSS
jgi:hypothetical protein